MPLPGTSILVSLNLESLGNETTFPLSYIGSYVLPSTSFSPFLETD